MTLKDVARFAKDLSATAQNNREIAAPNYLWQVIRALEADPEFGLPERVEALVKEIEKNIPLNPEPGVARTEHAAGVAMGVNGIARRLRELLEAK